MNADTPGAVLPGWAGPLTLAVALLAAAGVLVALLWPAPELAVQLRQNQTALSRAASGADAGFEASVAADATGTAPAAVAGTVARAEAAFEQGRRVGLADARAVGPAPAAPCPETTGAPACPADVAVLGLLGRWLGQLQGACQVAALDARFWDRQLTVVEQLRRRIESAGVDHRLLERLITPAAPRSDERLHRARLCAWAQAIDTAS